MKVNTSNRKFVKRYNPNSSRKARRYKSREMQRSRRSPLSEQARVIKNSEHKHKCSSKHCCQGV